MKRLVLNFTSLFQRNPNAEQWPEPPRELHLATASILGMPISGGVYEAEPGDFSPSH